MHSCHLHHLLVFHSTGVEAMLPLLQAGTRDMVSLAVSALGSC